MKLTHSVAILFIGFSLVIKYNRCSKHYAFPVKVSENGRYLVDQNDHPVFWLGKTRWQIFREYNLDEARTTIENIKSKGFVFIQAMLMGAGDGTQASIHGEKSRINDDPLTPNEAYFLHVDSVTEIACEYEVNFSFLMYHQRYRHLNYSSNET